MFEGFDLSNLTSNEVLFLIVLILLDRFGLFSWIKNGISKVYGDIKKSDNSKEIKQINGNIQLTKEALNIFKESQKLILLDIPHKLDEVIDELHEIKLEMRDLIHAIDKIVKRE